MHAQGIALLRWLRWHRYQLSLATALVIVVALLTVVAPLLLGLAAVEWKQPRSRRPRLLALALLVLLAQAAWWLWVEVRGLPHGAWHPCAQCGASIEQPSQGLYYSPLFRRYTRLERAAAGGDYEATRRLSRLRSEDRYEPALPEIPF